MTRWVYTLHITHCNTTPKKRPSTERHTQAEDNALLVLLWCHNFLIKKNAFYGIVLLVFIAFTKIDHVIIIHNLLFLLKKNLSDDMHGHSFAGAQTTDPEVVDQRRLQISIIFERSQLHDLHQNNQQQYVSKQP